MRHPFPIEDSEEVSELRERGVMGDGEFLDMLIHLGQMARHPSVCAGQTELEAVKSMMGEAYHPDTLKEFVEKFKGLL